MGGEAVTSGIEGGFFPRGSGFRAFGFRSIGSGGGGFQFGSHWLVLLSVPSIHVRVAETNWGFWYVVEELGGNIVKKGVTGLADKPAKWLCHSVSWELSCRKSGPNFSGSEETYAEQATVNYG